MSKMLNLFVYVATIVGLSHAFVVPPRQEQVVHYNCRNPKHYALTFDDGPHPTLTSEVLDLLAALNVKATFFIMGNGVWEWNLARYKQNVQRAHRDGHHIGSHIWSHSDLTALSDAQVRTELRDLENLFSETLNVRPKIFRPPFMAVDTRVLNILRNEFNYEVILSNINTEDYNHPGDTPAGMQDYYNAVTTNRAQSYIALHHDVQVGAVELAAAAIAYMQTQGFTPVTVAECIGVAPYQ